MGTVYDVYPINIMWHSAEAVEALLRYYDIEPIFEVYNYKEKTKIIQSEAHMTYHSCEDVDKFLDDVAKLLKGSPEDGQAVFYDWNGGESVGRHIFVDGKRIEVEEREIVVPSEDVRIGEKYEATVTTQVIGLKKGSVLVVG